MNKELLTFKDLKKEASKKLTDIAKIFGVFLGFLAIPMILVIAFRTKDAIIQIIEIAVVITILLLILFLKTIRVNRYILEIIKSKNFIIEADTVSRVDGEIFANGEHGTKYFAHIYFNNGNEFCDYNVDKKAEANEVYPENKKFYIIKVPMNSSDAADESKDRGRNILSSIMMSNVRNGYMTIKLCDADKYVLDDELKLLLMRGE